MACKEGNEEEWTFLSSLEEEEVAGGTFETWEGMKEKTLKSNEFCGPHVLKTCDGYNTDLRAPDEIDEEDQNDHQKI